MTCWFGQLEATLHLLAVLFPDDVNAADVIQSSNGEHHIHVKKLELFVGMLEPLYAVVQALLDKYKRSRIDQLACIANASEDSDVQRVILHEQRILAWTYIAPWPLSLDSLRPVGRFLAMKTDEHAWRQEGKLSEPGASTVFLGVSPFKEAADASVAYFLETDHKQAERTTLQKALQPLMLQDVPDAAPLFSRYRGCVESFLMFHLDAVVPKLVLASSQRPERSSEEKD